MGNEQKDRFGDKMRDLEHAREDKFFADREKELLKKLREESICRKCGEPLVQSAESGSPRHCKNGHGE